jgi:hypothetical protein
MTFKDLLLHTIHSSKYARVDGLRKILDIHKKNIPSTTLYATLYRLVEANIIFDAGRGWYSTIPTSFTPRYAPINKIVRQIEKQFPLLQFSVWSTEQLQPFAHHLMGRFTVYVYTDTDAISSMTRFLQSHKHNAYPNPRQSEVEKYITSTNNRIIVRPLITEEPLDRHYATIEKTLVDLFFEKDRLFLMDGKEYKRIFENLIFSNRINMGRLLRYAARRNIKTSMVKQLSDNSSTIIM